MKNKSNISKNSLKSMPFLSDIEKENNFSTPKNYFKVLPEIICDKKLNTNLLQKIIDKLSWRILVPITSLIVVIFIVFNFNNKTIKATLTNKQLATLIINEDYLEIDDGLIYDAYAKILDEDENKNSLEDKEYINYLIDNDIDVDLIIEEF